MTQRSGRPNIDATSSGATPSRAILAERAATMQALHPVVQLLALTIGPNVEVVLHDLTTPEHSVVAIANGHLSNRTVGSAIIAGPKDDKGFHEARRQLTASGSREHSLIGHYVTVTSAGVKLRSSTVIFRDSAGVPYAALCVNSDLATFRDMHALLETYLHPRAEPIREQQTQPAIDALMREIIDEAVRRSGKSVGLMKKEEKKLAVKAMLQRGLFLVKGGVERAAEALGVSRFTIYNYLEALRQRGGASDADTE
ncbi:MAG: PAS domain-containing protein [Dokdonella sp.]|uniref:helix-turn-helix transcriptional regulator n=1 Tax=Dokdonella sp. TaxID=2291710 RepID=UPI003266B8BF